MIERTGFDAPTDQDLPELRPTEGATPLYACGFDQRFSYCLYVPLGIDDQDARDRPLVVTVHGTGRRAEEYRDAFANFAEDYGCVILAPLFPGGIVQQWKVGSYKLVRDGDLRYDQILLTMIEEVAGVLRIETSRFLLHGFSGGGQFAHRFFYLHPERLLGLSIGAPGSVTLLEETRDWWAGIRNFAAIFGCLPDYNAMRRVPVQMVIGSEDTEDVTVTPGQRRWMEGANDAGVTRFDRLASLQKSYARQGIAVEYEIVPDVGHDAFKLLWPVKSFFGNVLMDQSDRTRRP